MGMLSSILACESRASNGLAAGSSQPAEETGRHPFKPEGSGHGAPLPAIMARSVHPPRCSHALKSPPRLRALDANRCLSVSVVFSPGCEARGYRCTRSRLASMPTRRAPSRLYFLFRLARPPVLRVDRGMTVPQSILAAAAVIGACIIAAQLIAPYQISSSVAAFAWRVNRVTGDIRQCHPSGCE